MKKIRLLIIFSFIICCLLTVCACDDGVSALSKPKNVAVEETTLILTWDETKDARMYTISIDSESGDHKEVIASKTSYSLTSLAVGNYTIRVMANGKDGISKDSEWSDPVPFKREAEPGMVFTLSKDGTEYELTNKGIATGDIVIPETYRGKPVTSIGKKAFFNKSDVDSITMSDNIRSIGDFAFANCSYLTTVNLSSNLTHIGESAFSGCRLLSGELTIPEGVSEIPAGVFAYCAKLTKVNLGSKITSIGNNAFTDCRSIEEIVLPDSVISIGEYAFSNCSGAIKLDMGSGVADIAAYAFSGLSKLVSVTIEDGVKKIGEGAFYKCEALESVEIGSGVEMIDLAAFEQTKLWEDNSANEVYVGKWFLGLKDTKATEIDLREDTVGIANYAFARNNVLNSIILPNSVKIIGSCAFASASINSVIIGSGVEIIGQEAFADCGNLTRVILGSYDLELGVMISSSLKTIDSYAFRYCTSLNEIEIPESVTTIATYVFRDTGIWDRATGGVVYADNWIVDFNDYLVGDVIVNDGTVGIANYAFYKCDELTSIVIPNTVKTIGRAAFYQCTGLVAVELPETLQVIEDYTFYHCDRLKSFTLPPMLKSIGRSAFYKCCSVYEEGDEDIEFDTLTIPTGVEFIGAYAFYGCGEKVNTSLDEENAEIRIHGIDTVVIGDGVKVIEDHAFHAFVSLKKVVIGNGVTRIGEKAFYDCVSLEEVVFGTSLETIGNKAFYKCSALSSLTIPDGVTEIGDYAFYKCTELEDVVFGSDIERIGNFAFYGCDKISKLDLPVSLVSIGKQAFRNCLGLTSVILGNNVEEIAAHAFYGCKNLTIYTEAASKSEGWDLRWNSSYRPVVWGCALSEEKDYVVSFVKSAGNITNLNISNSLSAPILEGCVFLGWSTVSSAVEATYTLDTLDEVPDGRTLYAVYAEAVTEE